VDGLPWLTHADFVGHVGEEFELADIGLVLTLAEATESSEPGASDPEGRTRNQFSLVFTGPLAPAMEQSTVSLEHPDLGELHLFLVPLGPRGDAMRYEAAFA
jgi:hypothetical protein